MGTSAFADTKLYEAVIGRLFPAEVGSRVPGVRLVYTYCNSGEVQIEIHEIGGKGLDVEVWKLPHGSPTVWNQIATMVAENPGMDAEHLAEAIIVHHESLSLGRQSELATLIEGARPRQVSITGGNALFLEGSEYRLTVASPTKTVNIVISGPQNPAASEEPLIRWMGRVRTEVERSGPH